MKGVEKNNMMRIVWGLVLGAAMWGLWTYANAEVPGGEKRYEQYVRLLMDRHAGDLPKVADF